MVGDHVSKRCEAGSGWGSWATPGTAGCLTSSGSGARGRLSRPPCLRWAGRVAGLASSRRMRPLAYQVMAARVLIRSIRKRRVAASGAGFERSWPSAAEKEQEGSGVRVEKPLRVRVVV